MAAIVGSGDYRYEIVDSWPKMPKYWSFGGPSGAAVNSDDEVYVFSRGVHPVTIWTPTGTSSRRGARASSAALTAYTSRRTTTSG